MSSGSQQNRRYLNQTWYIILFILGLSLFSGLLLSTVCYVLSPIQEKAAIFDRNQQMLTAAHVLDFHGKFQIREGDTWEPAIYNKTKNILTKTSANKSPVVTASVLDTYAQHFVRPLLANREGKIFSFEEKRIDPTVFIENTKDFHRQPLLLFYAILNNTPESAKMSPAEVIQHPKSIQSIVIPISGFGLWGPIYGYLGLENNGDTVLGTAWYQQGETPGLGANITNPSWQKQFFGKKIFLNTTSGNTDFSTSPLGIEVIKGQVQSVLGNSPKAASSVDGISGATLTCNGVTEAYAHSLAPYRSLLIYFANLNSSGENHDG
ncbi:ubiquinone oxidoreductase, Na(+)-translocating, C subunit [Chlamydia ibidis]|uniref:Na(+)-translocating NADH-quinone reductase subunit C n=2 Tax=Chlamydia ibidis TaxID=1405396 RepID=S7J3P8_9CHLA|nr:NADH:ubiquinone reductase (Na(+)-transporting) subunit C [Chlamydia ibidis]EPP35049.1 ubiquinone oxidoreductase, Na(+)-translocating, C subunit [Chlamydia ibidis]EQM62746.1 ubiquinone oxidoreductase, Na(+)-translocating, C subunit [Chlamydia ibidis 10-1398/6]